MSSVGTMVDSFQLLLIFFISDFFVDLLKKQIVEWEFQSMRALFF